MKKASILFFVLFFSITFYGFSQTAPKDFFAAKWEISITGTPNGDAKFVTELTRKDGKLTGELKDPTGKQAEALPITKIEEENNKITIYFTAQDYDVNIVLAKVDENNLKGMLLDQFESTATRVNK